MHQYVCFIGLFSVLVAAGLEGILNVSFAIAVAEF